MGNISKGPFWGAVFTVTSELSFTILQGWLFQTAAEGLEGNQVKCFVCRSEGRKSFLLITR